MDDRIKNDEVEIDLKELFYVLWDHIWTILFAGLAVGLAALFITKAFITPQYESTTKMYVLSKASDASNNSVTSSELQTGSMLTNDYMQLVTSGPVMEQVVTQLNLEIDSEELAKKISVSTPTDTRILAITVTDDDPYVARDIADATRVAASSHIADVTGAEAVNVVENANIPKKQSSPSIMKNTMIGGLVGLFLAILILILNYMLNDSLRTSEDVEKYLGVSVLGVIPIGENEKKSKKKKRQNKRGKK
ncbi:MAG: Wzz/FepE/Etk N-terminal domain-containing protein [Lachnospiraceae bacterium]|nr:Wzz/FepE/Etk N-terminal domain-containing protein [Lachnospiraceae bacterium]